MSSNDVRNQHSSDMMNEWTPKTPVSSGSIIRTHSSYYESAGPVVPEGFVAARVRALHALNHAEIATRSHGP